MQLSWLIKMIYNEHNGDNSDHDYHDDQSYHDHDQGWCAGVGGDHAGNNCHDIAVIMMIMIIKVIVIMILQW